MQLIVGLGNPGDRYQNNRHNTGFMAIDALTARVSGSGLLFEPSKKFDSLVIKYKNLVFAKPQTFMNSSGPAARKIVEFYKIETPDIWVIHDDLDIKLGQYKIQKGIGPKLHNGIESIEKSLGKNDFWRLRIGVDNRSADNRISGEDYVLKDFSDDEKKDLDGVINKACDEMIKYLNI